MSNHKLGNLVQIRSGDSPSKYDLKNSGVYPFLKVEDLNNCKKYQEHSRTYIEAIENPIPANSIIFPKRGAAILNNKVRITKIPCQLDSNLMAITPVGTSLNYEYLYYFITNEKLFKIADTSTIPQINNKHIQPYKIVLPDIETQQKTVEILSNIDKQLELYLSLKDSLSLQKQGLMQQLLTGKKRVKIN